MTSAMPELGSKISLISKADIRYEGRLFTVDPQECTIALASVRSFGTEDRETQFPVAPQSQVYDYILFRGADIKDIRVVNNVPSMPHDPAIMQMSAPPMLGGANNGPPPGQFAGQFNHPVVGQPQFQQYHPMSGFPGSVHAQMNKTSELSPQTSVELPTQAHPTAGPIGSGVHHINQVKDQGSMLDLIGGGSQQNSSRSATPALGRRKSPTVEQGTQVGMGAGGSGQQKDTRRSSNTMRQPAPQQMQHNQHNQNQSNQQHNNQHQNNQHHQNQYQQNRNNSQNRTRPRYPSGGNASGPSNNSNAPMPMAHMQQNQYQHPGGYNNRGGGGWRGRGRGRGRGGFASRPNNKLKFENDYDFEQANTEFEELRSKLAKAKISEGEPKQEQAVEVEKKDDSGNETGAGEPEPEDELITYDKTKSFFDNISCEAIERSKGRSQRTDWRTERKLNSETFGVASARRGAWRGRSNWRHPQRWNTRPHQNNHHNATPAVAPAK